ncbi:uncharacterized protein NECHADRAFT_98115 [Fusarium vanettenii 77-13-4]|uniref:BZIP domain-containing protein n=1 Tax=Fusarium vanettenii (strain ATCC MYA-4622 / CBS 123669 / FGSC 9596 / NRRL 45880 / 77-13-4) TaxID=660122 RepID=C7ZBJ1_FUSV7|nr:uncharacterized protein NECHADRAFT_98115 [Fusarium vanettenii 77-13-4]EEU38536.1 hypothetical protein NECHADRAFT_98115 [Fusarium vanettenii 77-13-4]
MSPTLIQPPLVNDNLARIRHNQRRSRARRKEYLLELEQRVGAHELQGIEASCDIQRAARRLRPIQRRRSVSRAPPDEAARSLQRDLALRTSAPLPTVVSGSVASASTGSFSLWELRRPAQPSPAYGRPLPSNVPPAVEQPSTSTQTHSRHNPVQVVPHIGLCHLDTAPELLIEDDSRRQRHPDMPVPDVSSTLGYSIPMNHFHYPTRSDAGFWGLVGQTQDP